MSSKPKCLYCDVDIDVSEEWAVIVNKKYDRPIFCGPACERDYDMAIDQCEEELEGEDYG